MRVTLSPSYSSTTMRCAFYRSQISSCVVSFIHSFLCLFCLIQKKFQPLSRPQIAPLQAVFSKINEQHPSSLGGTFHVWMGHYGRTRRFAEIYAVDGHSVGTYHISSTLFLIVSSLVWFLHPDNILYHHTDFSFFLKHFQICRTFSEKDREQD